MVTFFAALAILIVGAFIYSKFVDNIFQPSDSLTPALLHPDGVDYMPMPTWKLFMIQLLNIAGLGPIFGAIAGALWGPIVYFWIVFGTLLSGAVHDYFSGMISLRHDGESVSELSGIYLGNVMRNVMRVFAVVLLVLVGTVFMTGPAMLLAKLFPALTKNIWLLIIIVYYFLATLLPIDKIIGKFYPIFGVCLIVMAVGVAGGIIAGGWVMPEMQLENLHPKALPIWPLMFITVACGATSGFHATQSPMIARCMTSEREGRLVFYGAMVAEGAIALVWAAAGVAFYNTTGGLAAALAVGGPAGAVYDISFGTLSILGGILAMVGVVACPITSGDTAFRSARLTLADWFKVEQESFSKRLLVALPLLGIGVILSQMDFSIIWRYFAWANQTLAMVALWVAAMYLWVNNPGRWVHWIAGIPAVFMTAVTFTYILQAPEGLQLPVSISYPAGIAIAVLITLLYIKKTYFSPVKEIPTK